MAKAKYTSRYRQGYGKVFTRKTKDGESWYCDLRKWGLGKRAIPLARSEEEALIACEEIRRRAFDAEYGVKREQEKITFSKLAEKYIVHVSREGGKKSWKDDQYRLDANMKPFFGAYKLHEITSFVAEEYREARLAEGVSKSTTNREIVIMKHMFNLAIEWKLTEENPFTKVKLFSEKGAQRKRILGDDEEVRLFKELPAYLKPIVTVALNTGMRRGEIFNLRWSHVDLVKGSITVTQTKSGEDRTIPIFPDVRTELERLRLSSVSTGLVFPNPKTGKPYTEVKGSFRNACERAGILDLHFHDLRHTFSTWLDTMGVGRGTITSFLGHADERMTGRYVNAGWDQMKAVVDRLGSRTGKVVPTGENLSHGCPASEVSPVPAPLTNAESAN